jgi:hypothetical protein
VLLASSWIVQQKKCEFVVVQRNMTRVLGVAFGAALLALFQNLSSFIHNIAQFLAVRNLLPNCAVAPFVINPVTCDSSCTYQSTRFQQQTASIQPFDEETNASLAVLNRAVTNAVARSSKQQAVLPHSGCPS